MFLWVLEENLGARHFYEKEGFSATDDDLNDNIGGKDLREIRYIYGDSNYGVHNQRNLKRRILFA